MFKFSFNLVKEICGIDISQEELFNILNLQGFEVDEKVEKDNDIIVTIEVKANRPDMLSHLGVAREICAFKGLDIPSVPKLEKVQNTETFPIKVDVDSEVATRFSMLVLDKIDNKVETPEYIKDLLNKLSINCVNAIVDIANYVMLKYGQPMHTYDIDKITGDSIYVRKGEKAENITTLGGIELRVSENDILVSDTNALCIAGVIGTEKSAVEENSKTILIEAACFDKISVRLTSRKLKVSTPSSFRFERGINEDESLEICNICANLIREICGGEIKQTVFDFYPSPKKDKFVNLRVSRSNLLVGLSLSSSDIVNYLEKYELKCQVKDGDNISVKIPRYRLDLDLEVDLIEEVARIHGYDNIKPCMPVTRVSYNKSTVWDNSDKLRNIFIGLNFYEVITYSFIPSNFSSLLNIDKNSKLYSNLILQNPINKEYSIMRPTLAYSLLSSLAYNYSMNNQDLALFEIGRVYYQDEKSRFKTGFMEMDTLGFIFSGKRVKRGWGVDKDIKYSYYDLLNYVNVIFNEFGQNFELKPVDHGFLVAKTGYEILSNGKTVGFLGEMNKKHINKIQNVKLIRDPIFYCEVYIKDLEEKCKKLDFESKYPCLVRTYNFLVKKSVQSREIEKIIKDSSNLVQEVKICDIYTDKTIKTDSHALLYEVKFCSSEFTLTSDQIEKIEQDFIKKLNLDLNVSFKQ